MTIRTSLTLGAVLVGAVCVASGVAVSAENESEQVRLIDENDGLRADSASGRLTIRIPASTEGSGDNEVPTEDGGQPPSEPKGPSSETRGDPPTFFGQPVGGRFVWVLDVSVSMHKTDVGSTEDFDGNVVSNATRLDVVKFETVRTLSDLTEGDEFDFVLLAGMDHGHGGGERVTETWRGELTAATPEVRDQAIEYVMNVETWFGTPTYRALERATHDYGEEIDKLIFLSDGAPVPQHSYGGHIEKILQDFPGWFAPLKNNGCELVVFHIGLNSKAGTFMEDLAAQNSATYIHR